MAGALIVAAELGAADLAWLDRLRREHYPAERNQVPAHLTMFHALPPSAEGEVRRSLGQLATEPAPRASIEGLMDLGGGVAFRIVSTDLDASAWNSGPRQQAPGSMKSWGSIMMQGALEMMSLDDAQISLSAPSTSRMSAVNGP